MPLADRPPLKAPPRGSCGLVKAGLTTDELAVVETWFDGYTDGAIASRLAEDDYQVSYQVIARHRQHNCHCYRGGGA